MFLKTWFLIFFFSISAASLVQGRDPEGAGNFHSYFLNETADSLNSRIITKTEKSDSSDASVFLGPPEVFVDSQLLTGAEVTSPFHPTESLVITTRLWKTDIRFGVSQKFKYGIISFLSFRDIDEPQTHNLNLYEAGIKINYGWGKMWFGQMRIQAGENSYYLNLEFEDNMWNRGIIFDYLMRGGGAIVNAGEGKAELFIGSDKYSYFIGGGKYFFQTFDGLKSCASAIYVARDNQYAGFGTQLGFEVNESFGRFKGYQFVSYKKFQQEPSAITELNVFAEGRFDAGSRLEFGAWCFFTSRKDLQAEQKGSRAGINLRYHAAEHFIPGLSLEIFRNAGFSEHHLKVSADISYFNKIRIVPVIKYIVTEFGPDIGSIIIEGRFGFGAGE